MNITLTIWDLLLIGAIQVIALIVTTYIKSKIDSEVKYGVELKKYKHEEKKEIGNKLYSIASRHLDGITDDEFVECMRLVPRLKANLPKVAEDLDAYLVLTAFMDGIHRDDADYKKWVKEWGDERDRVMKHANKLLGGL